MTIIYSGFDTIVFAVKGALSPHVIKRMEQGKANAEKERRDVPFHMKGLNFHMLLSSNGRKGGYAFVLNTGSLGQILAFKKNLSRIEWNGHVKIRALSLATLGWEKAFDQALKALEQLEFHVSGISLNRVDYCMDFLNTAMTMNPRAFVAHSRVKKTARYLVPSHENTDPYVRRTCVNTEQTIAATMRSDVFESITIGKMPGRQVIIYDKRREALDKRTFAWFKIWGIDRHDLTQTVRRVELRAGKDELVKFNIRTFEDFKTRIGDVFIKASQSVRMIDTQFSDSNVSRKPVHSTWLHVQNHVKEHLFDHVTNVTPSQILDVIAEEKAREYMAQIKGNIAGYAVCRDIGFKHISECLPDIIRTELEIATHDTETQFSKTYVRASDRLRFSER